jgi:hypothetical protein
MIAVSRSKGTVTSRYIHAIDTALVVADFLAPDSSSGSNPLPSRIERMHDAT